MFSCLNKLLFSGFLQFQGNFFNGRNNSKYRDLAPLIISYCFHLKLQQHRREDDDRFATIRPQNLIARQHQEHNRQGDEMRDQLEVYKKLRQNHQKEVRSLESRLQMEMNDHRRNLDREYDQQVHFVVVCLFFCVFVCLFFHTRLV